MPVSSSTTFPILPNLHGESDPHPQPLHQEAAKGTVPPKSDAAKSETADSTKPENADPATVPAAEPEANPNEGIMDKIEKIWECFADKVGINWLDRKWEDLTNKLPEPLSEIARTLGKVLLVVVILFLLPETIVWGIFAATCIVALVRHETFIHHHRIGHAVGHSMGYYTAARAVFHALSSSFAAEPHIALISTVVHLLVCGVSFFFVKHIKSEHQKKQATDKAAQEAAQKALKSDSTAKNASATESEAKSSSEADGKVKASGGQAPTVLTNPLPVQ
jgi:hypothetical protein